ncbi:hypothetical protein DPMN_005683 [Dreissena polymorpha]|uniref:Uncharacterized protein n=1 Tax=Dreissena polymorpha TaxID=45954 RepID=A0A9D4MTZ6_DREPO|nr:hypothetical protein DPMN_005683 [Dreissena polymorpha]
MEEHINIISDIVDEKLKAFLAEPKNSLLHDMERIVEKIIKALVVHRQKLIRLADESELCWRFVSKYESNPLASDSEDEKRMYSTEALANKKLKAER